MKISGLLLVTLALIYLYLWRSGQLGLLKPATAGPGQPVSAAGPRAWPPLPAPSAAEVPGLVPIPQPKSNYGVMAP